jgi:16S rRNA (cytosine967-C5)-methyltransferase
LRVNLNKISRVDYQTQLREQGIDSSAHEWLPSALTLQQPMPVSAMPGFQDGFFSVQDAGAQLAAYLLDITPGMRVLDACAAPGGKASHMLELAPEVSELLAVDVDAARVVKIKSNLARLGLRAKVLARDVTQRDGYWDGKPFDRILLDAPCSATGVIRRHPDIKLLRRPGDLVAFQQTQRKLLQVCFSMLAPGGRLLYATCSVAAEENQDVIKDFLRGESAASLADMTLQIPGALPLDPGWQLLPGGTADTDGFYYALLRK